MGSGVLPLTDGGADSAGAAGAPSAGAAQSAAGAAASKPPNSSWNSASLTSRWNAM
jgi:hypothetical protein